MSSESVPLLIGLDDFGNYCGAQWSRLVNKPFLGFNFILCISIERDFSVVLVFFYSLKVTRSIFHLFFNLVFAELLKKLKLFYIYKKKKKKESSVSLLEYKQIIQMKCKIIILHSKRTRISFTG
jgi:hypothetical protein